MMNSIAGALMWGGVGFFLLIVVLALLLLAFEVWMLVDAIKNPRLPTDQKVLWVVGMFFIHPVVAVAYYIYSRWYQKD